MGDAASIEERLDAAEELIDVFGADCAGIRESLVSAASGGTDAVRGIGRSIALAADACDAANEAMLRDAPPPIYPQSGDGFACPGADDCAFDQSRNRALPAIDGWEVPNPKTRKKVIARLTTSVTVYFGSTFVG